MKCLPLLLLALVPTIASARIGETPEECAKRYGAPVGGQTTDSTVFQKAGLVISVTFWEGKAATIVFAKSERDILKNPKPLSDAEQQALLEANGGGSKWIKAGGSAFLKSDWTTEDGKVTAQYNSSKNFLALLTAAHAKHLQEVREAEEKKALDGF